MTTFSVPLPDKKGGFFNFTVQGGAVLFAGSRYLTIPQRLCSDLIYQLGKLGFSFITGCANGVDNSFRQALAISDYKSYFITACAFKEKAKRFESYNALYVVPDGLPPKAALAKRTLWMTNKCSMLILFPSDPIGRGSALAFKSAIYNNKPVFVVSKTKPKESSLYTVLSSNLFGIVDGWWCVPPVYQDTGLSYEVV
jgi:hypothetical protein